MGSISQLSVNLLPKVVRISRKYIDQKREGIPSEDEETTHDLAIYTTRRRSNSSLIAGD
jgi:hypothetical protein